MTLKVVYDTNIIVSAALKPGSIPASLVALAIARHVRLFVSPAILEEYTEVLKRPKFGFNSRTVDMFLRDLKRVATTVRPTQKIRVAPDEPDNRFLECAQAARADYLVTGNKRHFPFPAFEGTKIASPAERGPIIGAGTVHVVGKFTPADINDEAVGLPPIVQILLQRTDAAGQLLADLAFDVQLQANGTVPLQIFAIPELLRNPGEQLAIAFQPLGGNVPPGRVRFRIGYFKGGSNAVEEPAP